MSEPRLTRAQAEELLGILQSPVTAFDCGQLCAPDNGGQPLCCHAESIVPTLYKVEYEVLSKRTRMWSKYVPQDAHQRELASDMRNCDMLAVCKGAAHCERDNRSIVCRTFPLEPYIGHDGQLAGLVYNYDFEGRCPLVGSRHEVLDAFIEECTRLWERTFLYSEAERWFYEGHSQTLRRRFGQRGRPVPVFRRDGIFLYPTARDGRVRRAPANARLS